MTAPQPWAGRHDLHTCAVDGCDEPRRKLSWCLLHASRWAEHGSSLWQPKTLEDRFWAKVQIRSSRACWEWVGGKDKAGYGHFSWDHSTMRVAHRVAYQLIVGVVSEDLQLDHLCRNTSCVNPAHLEPVTGRENKLRGNTVNASNYAKTHCLRGHPFDEANTAVTRKGNRRCRICAAEWTLANRERVNAQRRERHALRRAGLLVIEDETL